MANLILRSIVWLGAVAWWLALRKPAQRGWTDVATGMAPMFGLLLVGLGAALFAWTARTLASGVPNVIDAPAVLLTRGPFRFVRNPLYLAAAALFIGATTVYGFWEPRDAFVVVILALVIHLFVVYREEPATRRRLGPAYDAYRARVPRWLPRWSSAHE